ncbi:MAG: hypothetical protein ACSHUF_00415 [Candidatus Nasuia deltocephalinicola]
MYSCIKFFEKIFINFKNIIINIKFKKIRNFFPKKLILKYIKKLYFKNYNKKNMKYSYLKKKYIMLKNKFFFLNLKNVKR